MITGRFETRTPADEVAVSFGERFAKTTTTSRSGLGFETTRLLAANGACSGSNGLEPSPARSSSSSSSTQASSQSPSSSLSLAASSPSSVGGSESGVSAVRRRRRSGRLLFPRAQETLSHAISQILTNGFLRFPSHTQTRVICISRTQTAPGGDSVHDYPLLHSGQQLTDIAHELSSRWSLVLVYIFFQQLVQWTSWHSLRVEWGRVIGLFAALGWLIHEQLATSTTITPRHDIRTRQALEGLLGESECVDCDTLEEYVVDDCDEMSQVR